MAGDACISNVELIFDCGRKRSSLIECNEPSSFALLRESIIHSVMNRHDRIDIPEKFKRQRSTGRLYQEFSSAVSSKVDVQFLDQKHPNNPDYLVRAFSTPNVRNETPKDQNLFSVPLSSNRHSTPDEVGSIAVTPHENSDDGTCVVQDKSEKEVNIEENKSEKEEFDTDNLKLEKCNAVGENGLRLARRNSAKNIFENCSTYNISYANVAPMKQNSVSSKNENLNSNKIPAPEDKPAVCENYGANDSCYKEDECMTTEGGNFDDQISLCDSFFTHVINGDYKPTSEQSINSRVKHNLKLQNGKQALPEKLGRKETDILNLKTDGTQNELVNPKPTSNISQKAKKRIRKKNRKKSMEAPMYECAKCGVLYHVMPNMVNDVVRCLHCDFWTSVDPVFLKQERQIWSTCRIC